MLNKFVSIKVDDQNIFGIETDKGVIDLTNKNSEWKSLYDVVKNNGFDKLISSIDDSETIVAKGSYEYNIPISNPEKIICVGINLSLIHI